MVKLIVEIKKGAVIRIGSSQDVQVTIIDHDNPSIETVQQDLLMGARAFKKYVDEHSENFAKETAIPDENIWHEHPRKIMRHPILFRYRNDLSRKELIDTDIEHVAYMIGEGFDLGVLECDDENENGEKITRMIGCWKIKN